MRQPTAQAVHVVSTCSRSHGRDLKRYGAAVSAPTGQIWIVLPAKYDTNGSPGKMATSVRSPRSAKSMKGSPATSSAKRVQRAHWMQRSRSSSTRGPISMGLAQCRFSSTKRLSPGPCDIAWSWRGHSPPLSQTGQSRGWLRSRNSSTPSWALRAASEAVKIS